METRERMFFIAYLAVLSSKEKKQKLLIKVAKTVVYKKYFITFDTKIVIQKYHYYIVCIFMKIHASIPRYRYNTYIN